MSILIYILVMAGVTYLVRMIPFTAFRRQIKSTFIKSLLYYLPYAVLAAMTIPSIFYSTGDITTAAFGTLAAIILAIFNKPLIVVALAAAISALLTGLII